MNKTGDEIELDVFNIITNSQLAKEIKGNVYREGTRDLNPMEEDIIVSFLTGLDGQFQTGSVTVNIYVPDKDNVGRCRYLARKADEVVRALKPTDYRFSLGATIKSYKAEKVAMHFVNVKINFELKTF